METTSDSNLADATKRIAWRLMAIGHNRAELLMLEIQEERERARIMIFNATAMAILGLLAGMTITALIAAAAGSHYLAALGILTVIYAGGAILFYLRIRNLGKDWEAFPTTREQLEKDRKCLEKTLT